jgi:hypothetical protein
MHSVDRVHMAEPSATDHDNDRPLRRRPPHRVTRTSRTRGTAVFAGLVAGRGGCRVGVGSWRRRLCARPAEGGSCPREPCAGPAPTPARLVEPGCRPVGPGTHPREPFAWGGRTRRRPGGPAAWPKRTRTYLGETGIEADRMRGWQSRTGAHSSAPRVFLRWTCIKAALPSAYSASPCPDDVERVNDGRATLRVSARNRTRRQNSLAKVACSNRNRE